LLFEKSLSAGWRLEPGDFLSGPTLGAERRQLIAARITVRRKFHPEGGEIAGPWQVDRRFLLVQIWVVTLKGLDFFSNDLDESGADSSPLVGGGGDQAGGE
jgi:hypothetical protein